jgi:IclR family acetate operon transcriptional repressor
VTDVAARLGVSASTTHRLLEMLVYRDFAEQLPDRRYGSGPVLRRGTTPEASVAPLRAVALPHLQGLVDALGETANVMVLAGADVRFVATVECDHVLRVGDRTGRVLPARLSSGGKAARRQWHDRRAAGGRRPPVPGRPGGADARPSRDLLPVWGAALTGAAAAIAVELYGDDLSV